MDKRDPGLINAFETQRILRKLLGMSEGAKSLQNIDLSQEGKDLAQNAKGYSLIPIKKPSPKVSQNSPKDEFIDYQRELIASQLAQTQPPDPPQRIAKLNDRPLKKAAAMVEVLETVKPEITTAHDSNEVEVDQATHAELKAKKTEVDDIAVGKKEMAQLKAFSKMMAQKAAAKEAAAKQAEKDEDEEEED